ncbi:MAG: hypothetical protein KME30_17625 [Iphinoe sp. HA4291-MV1]|jgi:chromosome segregation ATPase|nr:hypothetical protein [Iphinoe sp. HA4291-MV1]
MAAKKHLSDLLQEEAQKFSPSDGETTIDVAAISDDNPSTSSNNDTGKEDGSAQLEEESKQAVTLITSEHTNPTTVELEATVKELKETVAKAQQKEASLVKKLKEILEKKETLEKAQQKEVYLVEELKETLAKAQQKEVYLQQEVTDLQSALSEQQKLAARLKTELDDAKQAAIQLAEANSQLTETISTISTLQQPKEKQKGNIQPQKSYKKSYRLPDKMPVSKPEESVETSSPMWLLD